MRVYLQINKCQQKKGGGGAPLLGLAKSTYLFLISIYLSPDELDVYIVINSCKIVSEI